MVISLIAMLYLQNPLEWPVIKGLALLPETIIRWNYSLLSSRQFRYLVSTVILAHILSALHSLICLMAGHILCYKL